jgi:ribosomal protein S18 acetylase RimI-like enzyme
LSHEHRVVPMTRDYVTGFHAVLDAVAREGRYLAFLEAPPLARIRRFVRNNLRDHAPQFVALDGNRVIGWCDVSIRSHETLRHSGALGMGLLSGYRGLGIGGNLLRLTLEEAARRGLTRIELVVRTDNQPAIALYRRYGFVTEARLRRYMVVNGTAQDALLMARLG